MSDIDDRDSQVEEADASKPRRRFDWSWNLWQNRLVYSFAAGAVVNLTLGTRKIGTVVGVLLFVLTSAIVSARRD